MRSQGTGGKGSRGDGSQWQARWFERLLAKLQFELWIGDAAKIRTKRVRKQKTDRQDAQLLLGLMLENRFPRIWVASGENRDLRQLLWHRHRMVQMRTRLMNQLQAVALNEGIRRKSQHQIFRYGCTFPLWPLLLLGSGPWPWSLPYSPSITRAFVLIRPICS